MPVKKYKSYTPVRRYMSNVDYSGLTKKRPEKSLTKVLKKNSGRNNKGTITVRHKGGGEKRLYRIVDCKMKELGKFTVTAIEYDPNRTAFIALLVDESKKKKYIIAPNGLKVKDVIEVSDKKIEPKIGNRMPLSCISEGSEIHNIELDAGKGGQCIRSAGAAAQLMSKEADYVQVKFPSGEVRNMLATCMASIGRVSNMDHGNIVIGKAGRVRRMGIRPTVRGKVMNPVDHPHGGGEARNSIGLKYPKTPWGKIAIGGKTRRKNRPSDKLIIKSRKKK